MDDETVSEISQVLPGVDPSEVATILQDDPEEQKDDPEDVDQKAAEPPTTPAGPPPTQTQKGDRRDRFE